MNFLAPPVEARGEVNLVWGLVVRETDVRIDAENAVFQPQRSELGVGLAQTLYESGDEGLEIGLGRQLLLLVLVEPGLFIVFL